MGGGNNTRSACNTVAAAKAYFGNLCSTQQLRKYGLPENFFGAAGPRSSAIRLEENSLSVAVFTNASRGAGNPGEESTEIAKPSLSCK